MNAGAKRQSPVNGATRHGSPGYRAFPCSPGIHAGAPLRTAAPCGACRMNDILTGDCVRLLAELPPESVDLAFADPPFNIGYDYDVYDDRRDKETYLQWTERWLRAVR